MTTLTIPTLIDPHLWARAGWMGIAWAAHDDLPIMAPLFTNREAARAIFAGWQVALGAVDHQDLLRVAIIEGEVPTMAPGYFAHLGLDLAAVTPRLAAATAVSYDATDGDAWHRLPNPGSPHLRAFKQAYARTGHYALIPAVLVDSRADFQSDLALRKTRLVFRHVRDVPRTGDPDSALWQRVR